MASSARLGHPKLLASVRMAGSDNPGSRFPSKGASGRKVNLDYRVKATVMEVYFDG